MDPCSTCRFWAETDWRYDDDGMKVAPTHGECRHKSPVVVSRPNGVSTRFPNTNASCGCGDHAEKVHEEDFQG